MSVITAMGCAPETEKPAEAGLLVVKRGAAYNRSSTGKDPDGRKTGSVQPQWLFGAMAHRLGDRRSRRRLDVHLRSTGRGLIEGPSSPRQSVRRPEKPPSKAAIARA